MKRDQHKYYQKGKWERRRFAPKELRAGETLAHLSPSPLQPACLAQGFQKEMSSQILPTSLKSLCGMPTFAFTAQPSVSEQGEVEKR